MKLVPCITALVILLSAPRPAAQCELYKLSDVGGESVAVQGGIALVGAPNHHALAFGSGEVQVVWKPSFLDPWQVVNVVYAYDGQTYDHFGSAVAFDFGRAVVGASGDDDVALDAGSAYVYTIFGGLGGWHLDAKLAPPELDQDDQFGAAVAVSGEWVAIAARHDDDQGPEAGAVYVFQKVGAGWDLVQKLYGTDGNWGRFGDSVAMDGGRMVVGAPTATVPPNSQQGAAYVFELQGGAWTQVARLVAADAEAYDWFGDAVDLHESLVVVGQPHKVDLNLGPGAAYVFEGTGGTWSQTAVLQPSDGETHDRFGRAVSVDAHRVLVGASNDDTGGVLNHGSAYLFARDGLLWKAVRKYVSCEAEGGDNAGLGVGLFGSWAFVGEPGDNPSGTGAALIWSAPPASTLASPSDVLCPAKSALAFPVHAEVLQPDGTAVNRKLGTVTAATEPGGRIVATFDLQEAGLSLDLCNDFRWIQVETGYSVAGSAQSSDPAVGLLPAIDPTPASDAMPFFYDDATWAGGWYLADQVHAEGELTRFVDQPTRPADTVTWFRTFLVARDHAGHSAPAEAPVPLAGFSWRYASASDTAVLCRELSAGDADVIQSALLIGLAAGHPGYPGYPGWGLTGGVALQSTIARLCVNSDVVSGSLGTEADFWLQFGVEYLGAAYLLLGTTSGTVPGTYLLGVTLPLNQDAYLQLTLANPTAAGLQGAQGVVDATGFEAAWFAPPPGMPPGYALHFAWAVVGPGVAAVSNPVEVRVAL